MKMNPVVHFEMPYKDAKRLSKFYANTFGWKMQYLPKMGSYVLATTSPVDVKGSVQFPIDSPLPLALITKIVKFRVKENEASKKREK